MAPHIGHRLIAFVDNPFAELKNGPACSTRNDPFKAKRAPGQAGAQSHRGNRAAAFKNLRVPRRHGRFAMHVELSALVHARAPAIRKDLLPPAWIRFEPGRRRIGARRHSGAGAFQPPGGFPAVRRRFRGLIRAGRYPPLSSRTVTESRSFWRRRGARVRAESIATVQFPR